MAVAVRWHTPESERAERRADEDAYEDAARLYAQSAFARLQQFGLGSLGTNGTMAVGDLLSALCCARQAGADERARALAGTVEAYASLIREYAHSRLRKEWPSMTWACLVGLCEEWTGDAYLFVRDETASQFYDRAASWYHVEECRDEYLDREAPAPCWQWGHEPEFDKAWGAFERYVDWSGVDPPENAETDYEVFTFERLAYKRRVLSATTA